MERQIATTSEQGQRLLRCGVSADTADMCWHGAIVPRGGSLTSMPDPSEEWYLWADPYSCMPEEMQAAKLLEDYNDIQPAWSLSALLGLLPPSITDENGTYFQLQLTASPHEEDCYKWDLSYYSIEGEITLFYIEAPDPIEAFVSIIEKLTADGYKLNEI